MEEYLSFRKLITPVVIQVLFWIAVVAFVLGGIAQLGQNAVGGILLIVLGPFVARVYAEILLVLFQMNAALQDIRARTPGAPTAPGTGLTS